jgi:raffinose/stachyose/melibiose transport system substrate-binding protein
LTKWKEDHLFQRAISEEDKGGYPKMDKRLFSTFAFFVVLTMLLGACGTEATTEAPQAEPTEAPPAEKVKLVMGWWGEQEAPGMSDWLDESIAMFEETHPNVEIEQVLESTENLAPSFKAAAAANEGPDIYTPWPGAWTIEDAMAGYYLPLDDYVSKETIDTLNENVRPDRSFGGKLYGYPIYLTTSAIAYNKSLFEQAGLDPEKHFETWDELIEGCEKLKAAGITPFTFGWKDAWISDWFWASWGVKNMDSVSDMIPLFTGEASANDPKYRDWLDKIYELQVNGYINDDVGSLEMSQGVDSIAAGNGAMSYVPDNTLFFLAEKMGDDLGGMPTPTFGTGKFADASCIGSSGGLSIPSWSDDPELAGEFIEFLLSEERVNSFFEQVGALPLNNRFDGSIIEPGSVSEMRYEIVFEKPVTFCPSLFTPVQVNEQGFYIAAQEVALGTMTPEEAAELIDAVILQWRTENPEALEDLVAWLSQ